MVPKWNIFCRTVRFDAGDIFYGRLLQRHFFCFCSCVIQDMVLCHTIRHASRIHCVRFCERVNGTGELMLVAAEDKKVTIYQVSEDPKEAPSIIGEMVGHSNRSVHSPESWIFYLTHGTASKQWRRLKSQSHRWKAVGSRQRLFVLSRLMGRYSCMIWRVCLQRARMDCSCNPWQSTIQRVLD